MKRIDVREEIERVLQGCSPHFQLRTDDYIHFEYRLDDKENILSSFYPIITIDPGQIAFVEQENEQMEKAIKRVLSLADRQYLQVLFNKYNAQTEEVQGSERFYLVLSDETLFEKGRLYVYDHQKNKWLSRFRLTEEVHVQTTFFKEDLNTLLSPIQWEVFSIQSVNTDEFQNYT